MSPFDKITATAPDHIWLDLGEEAHLVDDGTTFRDLGGVTWSEDNATGQGIKYVRALASHTGEATRQPSDGDFRRWAEKQGAEVNWNGEGSGITFTPGAWGRFCDVLRSTPPAATPAAPSDEVVAWAWEVFANSLHPVEMARRVAALSRPAPVAAPAPASEAVASLKRLIGSAVNYPHTERSQKWAAEVFALIDIIATTTPGDSADAPVQPLKDHQIAKMVNDLRDVAKAFHDHQSLRERIAHLVLPLAKDAPVQQAGIADLQAAHRLGFLRAAGWLQRDDLFADVNSQTYRKDRDHDLAALKGEQPVEPSGIERGEV